MIIEVILVLVSIQSVLVYGEKTDNEYPYLNSNIEEVNKRAFEALGKRNSLQAENIADELVEKNIILKKMIKLLLKELDNQHYNEKRGFEALGKRSSDDEERKNFDKLYPVFKRGFEALGKK